MRGPDAIGTAGGGFVPDARFGSGALVGLLLTISLTAILYAAWRWLSLPFVPFDLFAWTTRHLPGSVVTGGIDFMVKTIRGLHLGQTSDVAKLMEMSLAIGGFVAAGCLIGALFFGFARRLPGGSAVTAGAVLGTVLGAAVAWISASLSHVGEASPWVGVPWIVLAALAWGILLGHGLRRLRRRGTPGRGPAGLGEAAGPAVNGGAPGAAVPPGSVISAERIDRRRFLVRVGAATAAITVSGAVVGSLRPAMSGRQMATGRPWSSDHALPNADAVVRPAPGTRPELTPVADHYRTDIDTVPPRIDGDRWRLRTGGLVDSPREFTLQEFRDRYPPMHQFITLACISNPVGGDLVGTTRWTGTSLRNLLPDFGLKPEASHLKITSADDFYEVVSLQTIRDDPRVMLAHAWDGLPLTAVHGYPLRIYFPNVYGMKQPKWIESIEAIDRWEAGYWVVRGWSRTAIMKATSVIDTVATDRTFSQGGQMLVPIGGIARAGDRSISRVELQVDDGPWQEAELRIPLSQLTWVIWRLNWPFAADRHTFTVRCTDGQGVAQIATPSPAHPDGATGLDRARV
jgi:DMSO/TMAO reductase YedYZ molybdopterin-dependent catalytic subunit